jgi:hypothetical protein
MQWYQTQCYYYVQLAVFAGTEAEPHNLGALTDLQPVEITALTRTKPLSLLALPRYLVPNSLTTDPRLA